MYKFLKISLFVLICVLILAGCKKVVIAPSTLNDIAYDVNKIFGYTIYIPENGENIPYLVLTNNYNGDGNCLLLRKHLLDRAMVFHDYSIDRPGVRPSYYEDSYIDNYLSSEFLSNLSSVSDIIINSKIVITDNESISGTGNKSLIINRKIFLLSFTETDRSNSPNAVTEGVTLKCFKRPAVEIDIGFYNNTDYLSFRIATFKDGDTHDYGWWLRTPQTWSANAVWAVTRGGGGGSVGFLNTGEMDNGGVVLYGVRPAFCLPRDTSIIEVELNGETMYMLDLE